MLLLLLLFPVGGHRLRELLVPLQLLLVVNVLLVHCTHGERLSAIPAVAAARDGRGARARAPPARQVVDQRLVVARVHGEPERRRVVAEVLVVHQRLGLLHGERGPGERRLARGVVRARGVGSYGRHALRDHREAELLGVVCGGRECWSLLRRVLLGKCGVQYCTVCGRSPITRTLPRCSPRFQE